MNSLACMNRRNVTVHKGGIVSRQTFKKSEAIPILTIATIPTITATTAINTSITTSSP